MWWCLGYGRRSGYDSFGVIGGGEAQVVVWLLPEVRQWWCWGYCRSRGCYCIGVTTRDNAVVVMGLLQVRLWWC